MERVWDGVKAVWRFCNRVLDVMLICWACFWLVVWIAGSYQAGHVLGLYDLKPTIYRWMRGQ